jgi:hypothetical protein
MCLLVTRNSGSNWLPSKAEFDAAWDANPHGFGYSYHTPETGLMIYKTLTQGEAWETLQTLPASAPAIMHWRLATHGSRTRDNCHPFAFRTRKGRKRLWVGAHNGILHRQACLPDKTDSESFMASLDRIHPREIETRINSLGYGKMAFLGEAGELVICNESQGSWRVSGEVWQSNSGMDPATPFYGGYWDSEDGWQPRRAAYGQRQQTSWTQACCEWCGEDRDTTLWHNEDGDLICRGCKDHEARFEEVTR